jgi:hypothetical protein
MLEHLFLTYDSIIAVDLEDTFDHMRKAWDSQQPVETLFKQIQDCAGFYEAVGVAIGHAGKIKVGYAMIFATCNFMSAYRRWNEKEPSNNTWVNFKVHFAAAHHQHNNMQG